MATVTITDLPNLTPSANTYIPISDGTTTGRALSNSIGLPIGGIILWSGAANAIPAGWSLCDGTNGTPNLVDKFVLGAGTSTPAVGTTGGSKDAIVVSHTHTVTDPGHSHGVYASGQAAGGGFNNSAGRGITIPATTSVTTGITIAAAGQSGTNANMPPYYALCYIMKIS